MKKILTVVLAFVFIFSLFIPMSAKKVSDEKESALSLVYEADIPTLHELLKQGYITSRELTECYLERIKRYDEDYNCFILLLEDAALKKADECDEIISSGEDFGLLFGIPFVVKDNIDIAGYVTSNGKDDGFVATEDAVSIKLLSDAGAVILAKTNMTSHTMMARYTVSEISGQTKNAYSTALSAGGSSGGSAVSVSLNFASFGLGTDSGSSLRFPSALNGCVSLRTTYGLISSDGVSDAGVEKDILGAVTRSVKDQAIVLDVLTEQKHGFYKELVPNALAGAKIGIIKELTKVTKGSDFKKEDVDAEVTKAFNNTVEELKKCGAEIVEFSFPSFFELYKACGDKSEISEEGINEFYSAFEKVLEENGVSAVVFPSYLSSPMHSGFYGDGDPVAASEPYINTGGYFSAQMGIPQITVPMGTHSSGAGMGFEIATVKGKDQLLLNFANDYEEKHSHRQAPKNAENLHTNKTGLSLKGSVSDNNENADENDVENFEEEKKPFDLKNLLTFVPVVLIIAVVVFLILKNKKKEEK